MGSPSAPLLLGDDRYEVVRELGHGSFGTVYEVVDRRRGEVLALKLLQSVDGDSLYRFKREFRMLADTAHPNLVQLHELGTSSDEWYFTMELVRGQDFKSFVWPPAAAAPDVARLRAVLQQLVAGVTALHGRGILHRDLKPSNVLVDGEGRVVVLDFGIALERAGALDARLCGTPAYMAPECGEGRWSEAADWYAVGVMLYEALAGRRPIEVREMRDLPTKRVCPVPPLPAAALAAAPELAELCLELLAPDSLARPAAAEVLARVARAAAAPRAEPRALWVKDNATPFVGRQAELQTLRDAFERARTGTVVASLRGASGIGKTALLNTFLMWARRRLGATVLAGRCYQQESVPYKALDGLIDALSAQLLADTAVRAAALQPGVEILGWLFPVLMRVPRFPEFEEPEPGGDGGGLVDLRRRAADALRLALQALGARGPLLLVLDDAQWGDPDSTALLRRALESATPLPMLLVLVTRDGVAEPGALPAALVQAVTQLGGEHVELPIGPLPAADAAAVVRANLGAAEAAGLVDRLVAEAQGIPFFLEVLSRRGQGERDEAPLGLDAVVRASLDRLPSASAQLLELLAVAGRPVPEPVAREAAHDVGGGVVAALKGQRLLRAAGSAGEALDLYHDRIRQAILGGLDAEALQFRHRRLATVLERATPDDHESLFVHFDAAGDADAAVRHGLKAATVAAAKLAFARAAEIYARLLALPALPAPERPAVQAQHARMLAFAGRSLDAAAAYAALADAAAAADHRLRFNRLAGEQLLLGGHIDEGFRRLRTVLSAYGMRMPRSSGAAIASLLWQRLRLHAQGLNFRLRESTDVPPGLLEQLDSAMAIGRGLAIVDTVRGASFQTLCTRLALKSGERSRVAQALTMEIGYASAYGSGGVQRARRLHAMATALVDPADAAGQGTLLLGTGMIHHVGEGRFPEALAAFDKAEALLLQAAGTAWELDTLRLLATDALLYSGQLRELSRRARLYLQDATERGDAYLMSSMQMGSGHHRWLADDQPQVLRDEVAESLRLWSQKAFSWQQWWALWALTQADIYQGDGASAMVRLQAGWRGLRASQLPMVQMVAAESLHLRARALLTAAQADHGERRDLLGRALRDARRIERLGCSWPLPLAMLIRAGAAAIGGDHATALRQLASAEAVLAAHGPGLHLPAARWQLGRLRGGDAGRALTDAAEGALAEQGIRNPGAMARLLAPGFD